MDKTRFSIKHDIWKQKTNWLCILEIQQLWFWGNICHQKKKSRLRVTLQLQDSRLKFLSIFKTEKKTAQTSQTKSYKTTAESAVITALTQLVRNSYHQEVQQQNKQQ